MNLTNDQKEWFKNALEKKMKIKILKVYNTKKAKANAVIKDSDMMNEIMYEYESEYQTKFTEDIKNNLKTFYNNIIKNYFPREK